ncbi:MULTISPECIES: VWA domain-containing protein [Mameliella]|uniref:VWA domain-containing protein n=1 Tax=Mameliella TaxID=1434019 RepID=UPI0017E656E8|nr:MULTISPECIES: VWA domain-containing protein [Mameliella]MCR9271936.1 VWA domain-containing protein [Paracoccaceae bacterium]
MTPEDRLADLGLTLPAPVKLPKGLHLPFSLITVRGDRVLMSGHPAQDRTGRLIGADLHGDAYLFHPRLMRITDALRDRDMLRAAGRLSLMVEGFGGGTVIGGALRTFNRGYAARALNGRTAVLILSDRYCTGPPEAVAEELARLRRRTRRIVWLTPLPANTIAALEQELGRL